jgi:hypothetical protein
MKTKIVLITEYVLGEYDDVDRSLDPQSYRQAFIEDDRDLEDFTILAVRYDEVENTN